MTVEVKEYHLPPTTLIPNSPKPLLHYKNVLPKNPNTTHCSPVEAWDLFTKNSWDVQWIFRYSHTQTAHYHSATHECMAVLSGTADILFGVGDTSPDLHESTHGNAREEGGVLLKAEAGDVFVIPAGVAHKSHNTKPDAEFALLTPGHGHGIEADDPREALSRIQLSGFTMLGAYCGGEWDYVEKGTGCYFEKPLAVPTPPLDPVLGESEQGLRGRWHGK